MKQFVLVIITFYTLVLCPLEGWAQAALPEPAGAYAVGTFKAEITDGTRRDLYSPSEMRTIPVKVWYPTEGPGVEVEAYLGDEGLLKRMIAHGYNHQDSTSLVQMAAFKVHSGKNAPIAEGETFPLILFSHGLGVSTANYTLFAEHFASQGYIAVLVDHPYGGFIETKEGRLMSSRQDSLLNSEEFDSVLITRAREWAEDLRVVLDELLEEKTLLGKKFSVHIDQAKILSMGHSLGGNVALEFASTDPRLIAAVNLDGGSFGNLSGPIQVPSLTLRSQPVYSDEELRAKGRNRADWEAMGKTIDSVFSNALTGSAAAYEIKIKKAGHMSFSDAPYVLPDMISRFGGELLSPQESFRLIFGAIEVFLNAAFEEELPRFKEYLEGCDLCEMKVYQKKEE